MVGFSQVKHSFHRADNITEPEPCVLPKGTNYNIKWEGVHNRMNEKNESNNY